jgi:hypothetical protein
MKFLARASIILMLFSPLAMASGNATNDTMQTLSPADQADTLAQAVGKGCVGKNAFYMGMITQAGDQMNDALWSVECTNGQSYMVKLLPDQNGSTRTVECNDFKAKSGLSCFQKLE